MVLHLVLLILEGMLPAKEDQAVAGHIATVVLMLLRPLRLLLREPGSGNRHDLGRRFRHPFAGEIMRSRLQSCDPALDTFWLHLVLLILEGVLPAKEVQAVAGHIATIKANQAWEKLPGSMRLVLRQTSLGRNCLDLRACL